MLYVVLVGGCVVRACVVLVGVCVVHVWFKCSVNVCVCVCVCVFVFRICAYVCGVCGVCVVSSSRVLLQLEQVGR